MTLEWSVGVQARRHFVPCLTPPSCPLVLLLLWLVLGPFSDLTLFPIFKGVSSLPCRDWEGNIVSNGDEYTPDKDEPCRSCMCQNGLHIMCNMVLCSPPACMKIKTVENACCDFRCLNARPENAHPNRTADKNGVDNVKRRSDDDIADQGLRLAASTVTSFLVLALLLFMVHRLCQRRHLIQMRRLNAPRNHQDDDNDNNPFSQDAFSIGMPCPPPYEGPPPPYTLPKPFTYIQPCEAPPPYEEVQYQMAGHNPAFSDTLAGPNNRTMNPNDAAAACPELESNPSMHGLNLEGISCEMQSNVDNDEDSSLHETTPKTPFGADDNQFGSSPFTRSGNSPSITRPFSTFFGSCATASAAAVAGENSDGRQARNSCGSITARAERIRSCLFPSGKESQDGVALGLTRHQVAAAAISLRETEGKVLSSSSSASAPSSSAANAAATAASSSTSAAASSSSSTAAAAATASSSSASSSSKVDKFAPWYIKRSESIEIRRESHSPRNSYCFRNNYIPSDTSDSSESEQECSDVSSSWLKPSSNNNNNNNNNTSHTMGFALGSSNQPVSQSAPVGSTVSSFKPNVSGSNDSYSGWDKPTSNEAQTADSSSLGDSKGYQTTHQSSSEVSKSAVPGKPVRISYIDALTQQPGYNNGYTNGKTDTSDPGGGGDKCDIPKLNPANQLANSSFVQSRDFGGTSSSALQIRNSLHPLELKPLQPDLRKSEMVTQTSKITPPSVLSLTSGASGRGLLSVEHADDGLPDRGGFRGDLQQQQQQQHPHHHHPATILSGRLQSPGTPVSSGSSPSGNGMGTLLDRSNSLTSDISLFSICSETGEKRRPKHNSSSCASTPSTITSNITFETLHNAGSAGQLIKNENPYADPFHISKAGTGGGNSGSGGGGGGGNGSDNISNAVNTVNPVPAGANNLPPAQRHEPMTTASLVSNILKRYSDIPRQSVEHDENSYSKPSPTVAHPPPLPPTSLPPPTPSSSSLMAQHQHQNFKPQSMPLHGGTVTAGGANAHHPANAHTTYAPTNPHTTYAPTVSTGGTNSHHPTTYAPTNPHTTYAPTTLSTGGANSHHPANPPTNPHTTYAPTNPHTSYAPTNPHTTYAPTAAGPNAYHPSTSHLTHHSHHHSSWVCEPSIIQSAGATSGRLIKRSDCTMAQSYPRKSEIRSLDNRKSIDDIIRTIDITPVLQSIAKPLDILRESMHLGSSASGSGTKELTPNFPSGATSRTNSSATAAKTAASAAAAANAANAGNSSMTNFSKFAPLNTNSTDKTSPPPALPVYPKPKPSPADRKKRHSLGSMSKASKRSGHRSSSNHPENPNSKSASNTSSSLLNSMQNSFNMSSNQTAKSASSSNGQSQDGSSHGKICEPCYKQYGYVERLNALHVCGHKKDHGNKGVADHFKEKNTEKDGELSKLSPATMKYLTASPKSSTAAQLSYQTDTAHGSATKPHSSSSGSTGATATSAGAGSHNNNNNSSSNSNNNNSSSGYKVKKTTHPRVSPDHKTPKSSTSSGSHTHKSSSTGVSSGPTITSVEVHQPPAGAAPKKRHARSKDRNRKSYPGASSDTTPRETKIVSSPWLGPQPPSSSTASATTSRKTEKSHRSSKHSASTNLDLPLPPSSGNGGGSAGSQANRHSGSSQNHMSQLSSYV